VIIQITGSTVGTGVNLTVVNTAASVSGGVNVIVPNTPVSGTVNVSIPSYGSFAINARSASYAGTASYALNSLGSIESSSYTERVLWYNVADIPVGLLSSSAQILLVASASYADTASYALNSTTLPTGLVSSSVQINTGSFAGTLDGTATSASYVDWVDIDNKPTVVSSSAQISYTGVTNIPVGIVSSSTQAVSWTVATASLANAVAYINITGKPTLISASAQIDYTAITNQPTTIATASYVTFANVNNAPTLVSGSSQIIFTGVTGVPVGLVSSSTQVSFIGLVNVPANLVSASSQISYIGISNIPIGIVSSSAQASAWTVATASLANAVAYTNVTGKPVGLVSSSAQVSYTGITNIPTGIVSSSAQASAWTVATASLANAVAYTNVTGKPTLVSASSQIDYTAIANQPTTIATASYVTYTNVANRPTGLVSSSAQASAWTVATASVATSASYAETASYALNGGGTLPTGILSSSVQINALTNVSASFATTSYTASYISGGLVYIGLPADGVYGGVAGNVSGIATNDKLEDAFDKIEDILGKLAPAKPPLLSTRTLSIPNVYTALEESTGISRTTAITSSLPTASWTVAIATSGSSTTLSTDGDAGSLSAEFDGGVSSTSTRIMTTASDTGTFGNLIISQDADPYAGTFGQQGFWKGFIARTAPTSALSLGAHTTRLIHSTGGSTPLYTFYIDNPRTPTAVSMSVSASTYTGRYISGVPSLATGDIITATFTGSNAVSRFYNSTRINAASSTVASTVNQSLPASAPISGAFVSASIPVVILTNQYQETASFSGNTYNSQGVVHTSTVTASLGTSRLIRVDTVSTETRVYSGIGQYPAIGSAPSGTGGPWSLFASRSLDTNKELQMINGIYQYPPARTYVNNYPIAGPNYTALTPDTFGNVRWYTISQSVNAVSAISVTFNGATNFGAIQTTSSMWVYVQVSGSTPTAGWVDGATAYGGTGNPTNNGDPALVIGSSTTTLKRITFGSVALTGVLFVRVGLPTGSTRTFTSITIT